MNQKLPAVALVLAVAALCTLQARADFVRLVAFREFANQATAAGVRDVYHVFAEFTNPLDRVNTWYGTAQNPFTIQNVLADGVTLGSGFTNIGFSNLPPKTSGIPPQWDTFGTIGIRFAYEGPNGGNYAGELPFFPNIQGNSVSGQSGIIIFPGQGGEIQGEADFRVTGNDTASRVLLLQLTVHVGEQVRGTLNLGGQVMTANGYQDFSAIDQSFASVPLPSALPLLIISCCGITRRRR